MGVLEWKCMQRLGVKRGLIAGTAVSLLAICSLANAQSNPQNNQSQQPASPTDKPDAENQTQSLAKAVQNPVASLISVPFQNNTNFDIGPNNRTQNILNIEPVIPVRVSEKWNLIMRIITPVIYQPSIFSLVSQSSTPLNHLGTLGLGDMNPTFFLSPAKPKKLIWGVGPALVFPTATDDVLGQHKWSGGPSVVLLTQPGHWTFGALINNVWSFAGSNFTGTAPQLLPCGGCTQPVGISASSSVRQMLLQYFINYNLKKGWYIAWQPIITANWNARKAGDVWTVPVGGGIGRIMKFGNQPVNLQAQFFANATYPRFGSPWSMRLQVALLYPKMSKAQEKKALEQKLKELDQEQQAPPK
jgi:hypothetical protein